MAFSLNLIRLKRNILLTIVETTCSYRLNRVHQHASFML